MLPKAQHSTLPLINIAKRSFALYKEWDVWSYRKQKQHYQPKEYIYKKPQSVSSLYNDPQAPPNFVQENDGYNVWVGLPDTSISKIQAVENPRPIPKRIHFSSKDTYSSYAKRMHKHTMKSVRAYMRAVTEQRKELFDQEVNRRIKEIKNRQEIVGKWKREVKDNLHKNIAIRTQKRASELLHRQKIARENHERELQRQADMQAKQLEILLAEKEGTWITTPDRITPDLFADDNVRLPTGWWGTVNTKSEQDNEEVHEDFFTDDEEKVNYFKSSPPKWSKLREVYANLPIETKYDSSSN